MTAAERLLVEAEIEAAEAKVRRLREGLREVTGANDEVEPQGPRAGVPSRARAKGRRDPLQVFVDRPVTDVDAQKAKGLAREMGIKVRA